MAELDQRQVLASECDVFCRYLLGSEASPAVRTAYLRAHEVGAVGDRSACAPALDAALLRLARATPSWARAADDFAALFARPSLLRRKLVLLVGILECEPESASAIDHVAATELFPWLARSAARAVACWVRAVAVAGVIGALRVGFGWAASPGGPRR